MVCAERTRLQDVFAVAIDHHAKTVTSLHSATGTVFDKALRNAASSRQEAETARLAVETDRKIHRC